jgi:hypothetical protein
MESTTMNLTFLASLLVASTAATATADEWDALPVRKPEFGQKMTVSVEELVNEITPLIKVAPFSFDLAYWKPSELATEFKLASTRYIDGKPAPGDREFATTKEYDPLGDKVMIASVPDPELLARAVDNSDFALVPLRVLLRHQMQASSGSGAEKEHSGPGFHVKWSERFAGVRTLSMTPLQLTRGKSVRTFAPSGFRLIDHYMTFEDARDNSMMGAFCVRVLWHPNRVGENGVRPANGVFFAAKLKLVQIDWLKEGEIIPEKYWEAEEEDWKELLAEDLFDSFGAEALGDPFDSPSALAMRAMHPLTPAIVHRIANRTDPRLLAALAPVLLDEPVSYDPARFDAAYGKAVDPVQRLLLGAAAGAAGAKQRAQYVADCSIALHSERPTTLRAAFMLARVLGDAELAPSLATAVKRAPPAEAAIGALALGANASPAAREALLELTTSAPHALVKSAAIRGLADFGDAQDADRLSRESELAALDPATGELRVMLTGSKAGGALVEIHELAIAAKSGDVAKALTRIQSLAGGLTSTDMAIRTAGRAARDWYCRLASVVPALDGSKLEGSEGPAIRRIAMGSGRRVIPQLLAALKQAQGAQKKDVARIVGATKDPRVKETLQQLSDADADEENEAGSAGLIEFQKD